jgi:guanine deaminase
MAANDIAMATPAAAGQSLQGFLGTALHTPVRGRVEMLRDVLIAVDADGTITGIHPQKSSEGSELAQRLALSGRLTTLPTGCYLLPGLVDLHVHAPQWPQLGTALDLPLEDWLQRYTFPLEAKCADPDYAEAVYESLVAALLANGTTTAMYYGSIHLPATQRLADVCLRRGQRALIGRTAMDDAAEAPAYYRDASAASGAAETRAFLDYVHALPGNAARLILPVITPRFIPACSDELLRRLGALARETGCHVQTHCSESDWEHGTVIERCGRSDTLALEHFGLLGRHTILAHGNLVGPGDIERLVATGAGIAHCPLSNVYFSDAIFPLRHALACGVHVGLGTDIAGGASPSILENARHAVIASRRLEAGVDPALPRARRGRAESRIDALTAFWLATTAGGIALDLPIGVFAPGRQFDAIALSPDASGSNLALGVDDAPEAILERIVYGAARVNIRDVWVAGRQVHSMQQLT